MGDDIQSQEWSVIEWRLPGGMRFSAMTGPRPITLRELFATKLEQPTTMAAKCSSYLICAVHSAPGQKRVSGVNCPKC